jgi:hypothetical protein
MGKHPSYRPGQADPPCLMACAAATSSIAMEVLVKQDAVEGYLACLADRDLAVKEEDEL